MLTPQTLPFIISVPHGGRTIPEEFADRFLLTPGQIIEDGDRGSQEVYDLEQHVVSFISAQVARSVVDLNRAPDDFRADGIVKEVSIFGEPVWASPLSEAETQQLIERYYVPYHQRLDELSHEAALRGLVCVDCHTMCETAPSVSTDEGAPRPHVCIGNCNNQTCSEEVIGAFLEGFGQVFGARHVMIDAPFKGGYIIQRHSRRDGEMQAPWLQLEISRGAFEPRAVKAEMVLEAFRRVAELLG